MADDSEHLRLLRDKVQQIMTNPRIGSMPDSIRSTRGVTDRPSCGVR